MVKKELKMFRYGKVKAIDHDFLEAQDAVNAELENEGFVLMSQINVHEIVKEELGDETMPDYTILGYCNALIAHRTIQADEHAGLLLPINVIIYEHDGQIMAGYENPILKLSQTDSAEIKNLAENIEASLANAFSRLPG